MIETWTLILSTGPALKLGVYMSESNCDGSGKMDGGPSKIGAAHVVANGAMLLSPVAVPLQLGTCLIPVKMPELSRVCCT